MRSVVEGPEHDAFGTAPLAHPKGMCVSLVTFAAS